MRIFSDPLHRIAYSTDASVYTEFPAGVAYPETEADIASLIAEARRRGTCLIPRAAGTSIAGQVVGSGIVADIKGWNDILEIDAAKRTARVRPGVVRDELNLALKPYGLFFSPETSTSNRCCIGGMFGNNSCGTHSLIYGSTRDHVIACKGLLSDGSSFDSARLEEPSYLDSRPLLRFFVHLAFLCEVSPDPAADLRHLAPGSWLLQLLRILMQISRQRIPLQPVPAACGRPGCYLLTIRKTSTPGIIARLDPVSHFI